MSQAISIDQGFGVTTIDTGFKRAGLVASHLVQQGEHAAFIDVGVSHALPRLLEVVQQKNIKPEQVDYVMVTHVHLDHAGAAGVLMRELPNARLVVHPRGARHMMDPSRLVAGATAVYGEDEMRAVFGEIVPIDADRIIEATDEYRIDLGGRGLLFLDTPGHAKHHYCVYDEASQGIFTGDTFGLSYREFDTVKGAFIFPTTTPVQFDPDALHASIDRLLGYKPARLFLTHFGCVLEPQRFVEHLHGHIDEFVSIAREAENPVNADRHEVIRKKLGIYLLECLREHGCALSEEIILELMNMDLDLNAQGLVCWLDYQKKQASD